VFYEPLCDLAHLWAHYLIFFNLSKAKHTEQETDAKSKFLLEKKTYKVNKRTRSGTCKKYV